MAMIRSVLLFLAVVLTHVATGVLQKKAAASATSNFAEYVRAFSRDYERGSDEYSMREALFQSRVKAIEAQNAKPNRLWTAGLNLLTDRTEAELKQLRGWRRTGSGAGGRGSGGRRGSLLVVNAERASRESAPAHIDWRNTTSSKNLFDQGACGSCWAVATAAMLEAHHEIHQKSHRTFSVQELVHCVDNPKECGGSGGCQGATAELAMEYVKLHGLSTSDEIQYKGADLPREAITCPQKPTGQSEAPNFVEQKKRSLPALEWKTLEQNDALDLMKAMLQGPAVISAAAAEWSSYKEGIFDGCENDFVINHAVLLVGFGYEQKDERTTNYWIIQNSWGKGWGEEGFMRLYRSDTVKADNELCGVDHEPEVGVECKPYRDNVTVCGKCGKLYDSVSMNFESSLLQEGEAPMTRASLRAGFLAR